jgi:hypothetical protein
VRSPLSRENAKKLRFEDALGEIRIGRCQGINQKQQATLRFWFHSRNESALRI